MGFVIIAMSPWLTVIAIFSATTARMACQGVTNALKILPFANFAMNPSKIVTASPVAIMIDALTSLIVFVPCSSVFDTQEWGVLRLMIRWNEGRGGS